MFCVVHLKGFSPIWFFEVYKLAYPGLEPQIQEIIACRRFQFSIKKGRLHIKVVNDPSPLGSQCYYSPNCHPFDYGGKCFFKINPFPLFTSMHNQTCLEYLLLVSFHLFDFKYPFCCDGYFSF